MNQRQHTGRRGEDIATAYLQNAGYQLYGRNIRISRDEIDIIAFDPIDRVVVFAEVKARSTDRNGYRPEMNAPKHKRQRMLRAARRWVAQHNYQRGYRVDLVCVVGDRVVNHYREINSAI